MTSYLSFALILKIIFVLVVIFLAFKSLSIAYTKITRTFYSVPNKVEEQHFFIEEIKTKTAPYYLLKIRKTWKNKFINVYHRSISDESNYQYIENTEFHSFEDAKKVAMEISEYYAKQTSAPAIALVKENNTIA